MLIEKSLEKWKKNLSNVDKVDWGKWKQKSRHARELFVRNNEDFPLQILSDSCPLCDKYLHSHGCPLLELEAYCDGTCCEEWRKVWVASVTKADKEETREAILNMIGRLEECV